MQNCQEMPKCGFKPNIANGGGGYQNTFVGFLLKWFLIAMHSLVTILRKAFFPLPFHQFVTLTQSVCGTFIKCIIWYWKIKQNELVYFWWGFFCMFFLFFSFVLVICMFDCSVVRSDIKHYKWICSRYGSGLSSIKKNKKPVSLWISRWTPSQKGRNLGHNQKHAKEYQYQFLQGWNCSKSYVGGGVSCTSGGNSWVAVISDIRVGAWCHLVKQPALAKTNK